MLAQVWIDSRDPKRRNTFVETTALALRAKRGLRSGMHDNGLPDQSSRATPSHFEHVEVQLTPTERAPTNLSSTRRAIVPPVHQLDKRCPHKFKLVALTCY